jgi:ABC-type transport system involved in multi-copper enzyme maturation permease subunit
MKSFSETFLKTITGLIIIILFLLLTCGNGAFAILFFSIVCTAGVGLAFWIPAGFAVGSLVFSIAHLFSKNLNQENQPKLTRDELALVNYIKTAKKSGLNTNEISSRLKEKGWSEKKISIAFKNEDKVI